MSGPVRTMDVGFSENQVSLEAKASSPVKVTLRRLSWLVVPLSGLRSSADTSSTAEGGLVMMPHSVAIAWAVRAKSPVTFGRGLS